MNMFKKLWKKENSTDEPMIQSEEKNIKSGNNIIEPQKFYKHPKILLIDLKDESEKVLKSIGFNVSSGTFGTPYKVEKNADYLPIFVNAKLPNYQEQELIIIDLAANEMLEKPPLTERTIRGEDSFFGNCNQGTIDPRPTAVYLVHQDFNKILSHNGVFIVFADRHSPYETVFGMVTYELKIVGEGYNIWDFVDTLEKSKFETGSKYGTEIYINNPDTLLGKFLEKHLDKAEYYCTINPVTLTDFHTREILQYSNRNANAWKVLAVNKYDDPVAGVFTPDKDHNGWIFIFPQIADKSTFLLELLRDVLPEIVPDLFPFSDKKNWLERNEYQPVIVQKLNKQIKEIETETQRKIEKIKDDIQTHKQKIEYQNKLLTEDGDSLVDAVEETLKVLGFKNVVNVDEEYKKQGKTDSNDEDLQIHTESMTVLTEVKGVTGFPKDDDCLQILKHVPIRMREWDRTNVKSLSIINHQKAIPALDRENDMPFRQLLLDSASKQALGLMTTFDLYRLVRSFVKNNWKYENIAPIFLQSGRVSIIPSHYQYVGKIEHFYEQAGVVSVRIEENSINFGDTIAFELPIEFEEVKIESMQVEKVSVEVVETGRLAGIKTMLPKDKMKTGIKVYRVVLEASK